MSSLYYNCGNPELETTLNTSSVRIATDLLDAARLAAKVEHRTLQGQLE
ncbi:MAG: TA system antitoxin ParD family protein, partial [Aquiluna sp.]